MTQAQATAEIFLTAFKALSKLQQSLILEAMLRDKSLKEDLIDLAIAQSRTKEPSRSFKEVLASRHQHNRKAA